VAGNFKGSIKRTKRIYGVSSDVVITITDEGITMALPGSRKKLSSSWEQIARSLHTPNDVPSFLADKPIEFLKYYASKMVKKQGLETN
jgi:hypothetical protein